MHTARAHKHSVGGAVKVIAKSFRSKAEVESGPHTVVALSRHEQQSIARTKRRLRRNGVCSGDIGETASGACG